MNNIYTVSESAEIIAERWLGRSEELIRQGRSPLKLSKHEWHQLSWLAPLNRRTYSPRTWRRVSKLAVAHAKGLIASGRYPNCLSHFAKKS